MICVGTKRGCFEALGLKGKVFETIGTKWVIKPNNKSIHAFGIPGSVDR